MTSVSGCDRIERREDIPRAIARLHAIGGVAELRIPVLRAIYDGRIVALDVRAETSNRLVKAYLGAVDRPALVVFGDDVDEPIGPARMPSVERLMRWARVVVIHGTGGTVGQYKAAVATAERCRRLVLVECPSRSIDAWFDASCRWAPHAARLVLQPPAEGQHPSRDEVVR